MKPTILLPVLTILACAGAAYAEDQPRTFTPDQLRKGAILYPYQELANEDPMPLVKKYEGLRVSDVLDAMQAIGLQDRGLMDKDIRPLWRDNSDKVGHRFYGVAITYQYLLTNKPAAEKMPYADFKKWHSHWYRTYAPEAFVPIIRPGHALVIDAQGIDNTGFIGSNNALYWFSRGMTGVVTNGTCRDTDELILEKIPVYSKHQGGGTRPGRIEASAINIPVVVGGAMVRAGDMIVADGDGILVVPRERAEEVAKIAWDIANGDKAGRKKLYEKMRMPTDSTVK